MLDTPQRVVVKQQLNNKHAKLGSQQTLASPYADQQHCTAKPNHTANPNDTATQTAQPPPPAKPPRKKMRATYHDCTTEPLQSIADNALAEAPIPRSTALTNTNRQLPMANIGMSGQMALGLSIPLRTVLGSCACYLQTALQTIPNTLSARADLTRQCNATVHTTNKINLITTGHPLHFATRLPQSNQSPSLKLNSTNHNPNSPTA